MALLRHSLWYSAYVRMLIPHGYDLGATAGIIVFNFIIGGIIGGVILIWRLLVAAWYIPLTIYCLANAASTVVPDNDYEQPSE